MENATSAPGASLIPDGVGAFTAAHLAIIAVLAVLTVLAIVYGAKLRRDRRAAERERESRQEEMEAQAPVTAPVQPMPAPAHAQLADMPLATPAPPPSPPPPAEPLPDSDPLASEPIPAAAPMADNPAVEAASPEAAPSATAADGSITQLKGLGPKVAARLGQLGITTVGQIAALDDDSAARLDAELGTFRGRMARDRWIEQARFLAAGDRAGFEAVFGKL